MTNSNYFMAISCRILGQKKRYFIGYLIDKETEKHRYDLIVKEKKEMVYQCSLSKDTIARNKILGFTKKEHIKDFQRDSVEGFNRGNDLPRYYNWKKMMLGLFVAGLEGRGIDVKLIDTHNINYMIGIGK